MICVRKGINRFTKLFCFSKRWVWFWHSQHAEPNPRALCSAVITLLNIWKSTHLCRGVEATSRVSVSLMSSAPSSSISKWCHQSATWASDCSRCNCARHSAAYACPACSGNGGPSDSSDASHHAAQASLGQLQFNLCIHLGILLCLLVGIVQMFHQHGNHHVYQYELSCEHEGHEIHRGDELQSGMTAIVGSWTIGRALSQGVLMDKRVLREF